MLDNDSLITFMLDGVLRPSYPDNIENVFLRSFVKNIVRLDVSEKELDSAQCWSSYDIEERSACINILTEHNFISVRFNFKNLAKDWRIRHYTGKNLSRHIGEKVPRYINVSLYIGECESLSENEMPDETSVTFSEIKSWLSQCINTSGTEHRPQLNKLLSLMEQAASHPFLKHVLIKLCDFLTKLVPLKIKRLF